MVTFLPNYLKEMVIFAESECLKRNVFFLRLDCAGERSKLREFYESLGFEQAQRKMVNKYDVAFMKREYKNIVS